MSTRLSGSRTTLAIFVFLLTLMGLFLEAATSFFQQATPIGPFHDPVTGALFVLSSILLIVNELVLNSAKMIPSVFVRALIAGTSIATIVATFITGAVLRLTILHGRCVPAGDLIVDGFLWLAAAVPIIAIVVYCRQFRELLSRLPGEQKDSAGKRRAIVFFAATFAISAGAWLLNVWNGSNLHPNGF